MKDRSTRSSSELSFADDALQVRFEDFPSRLDPRLQVLFKLLCDSMLVNLLTVTSNLQQQSIKAQIINDAQTCLVGGVHVDVVPVSSKCSSHNREDCRWSWRTGQASMTCCWRGREALLRVFCTLSCSPFVKVSSDSSS